MNRKEEIALEFVDLEKEADFFLAALKMLNNNETQDSKKDKEIK